MRRAKNRCVEFWGGRRRKKNGRRRDPPAQRQRQQQRQRRAEKSGRRQAPPLQRQRPIVGRLRVDRGLDRWSSLSLWIGIEFGFADGFDVVVAFAIGSGDVPDEWRVVVLGIGVKFVCDGGESAQEEIAGVGENGAAARSDAVLRKELEESGE